MTGLTRIDKSEPRIVELSAPIRMIGVSMKTGMKTIYRDAITLGKEYRKIKRQNIVRNKKEPWAFVAVSKDFSKDNSMWEYLMGDVVTSFEYVPAGLIAFEIPVQTYAVFKIRPRFRLLWGPTIGMTKKYIFTEWLPNSRYLADDRIVGDFEYHDERSLSKRPSIDLYVPVKEKPDDVADKFHHNGNDERQHG